jgi:hypothetical protein
MSGVPLTQIDLTSVSIETGGAGACEVVDQIHACAHIETGIRSAVIVIHLTVISRKSQWAIACV